MKEIYSALLNAQKEMGKAVKGSQNPFFKSKYADLNSVREACIPILNKHNLIVLQPMAVIEGKSYIKTQLIHESGDLIESLTEIIYSKQGDAQAFGSGITYARRYGLQSLVNIGAYDDDGNNASIASNPPKSLPELKENTKQFSQCVQGLIKGYTIEQIKLKYKVSKEIQNKLEDEAAK